MKITVNKILFSICTAMSGIIITLISLISSNVTNDIKENKADIKEINKVLVVKKEILITLKNNQEFYIKQVEKFQEKEKMFNSFAIEKIENEEVNL